MLVSLSLSAVGQTMLPIMASPSKDFAIVHEDSLMDMSRDGSGKKDLQKINADLRLPAKGNPEPFQINFAKCDVSGDTIRINIQNNPGHFGFMYVITIVKNRYSISFMVQTPKDPVGPPILREHTKLVLNTLDLKKGHEIRGYTEFTGRCVPCEPTMGVLDVRGNFKVTLP